MFPAVRHAEMDLGGAFTMAVCARPPDAHFYNVTFVKTFAESPRGGGMSIHTPHVSRCLKEWAARGERFPIVNILGHHPAFWLGTLNNTKWGEDDYASAGAFMHAPVRLVPSVTWGKDFMVPADAPGLSANPPEKKMGLTGSTTTAMNFDDVPISADRLIGEEGEGLKIAFSALDSGRLGIAAVATGLAQGALDAAVRYAQVRETFGQRIIDHQGLAFILADMEANTQAARAITLHAARLRDAGLPFSREASVAKLVATDNAMKVTTDAVQVLGGYGYTRDFPVERYMREAKVMQIFEGTNQIQRMVISRALDVDNQGSVGHSD